MRRRGSTPSRCASHPLPASVHHVLSTCNVSDFAPRQGAFCGPVAGSRTLGTLLYFNLCLMSMVTVGYCSFYGTIHWQCNYLADFIIWLPTNLSVCLLRGAVKKTHGIRENVAEDAMCGFCCPLCVLCQAKREVDIRRPAWAVGPYTQQVQMQNAGYGAPYDIRPPASAPAVQVPNAGPYTQQVQMQNAGYVAPYGGAPQGYGGAMYR